MDRLKKTIKLVSTLGLFFPLVVMAQNGLQVPTKPLGLPGDPGGNRATSTLLTLIQVGLGVVGLLSVGFLIYGGFQYITSGGNDELAEAGKKTITNAIIGLVVVILSYVIVTVIIKAIADNQI